MDTEVEALRRRRQAELNGDAGPRGSLEESYGKVWDTEELRAEFEVIGFAAPLVVVRRRSDGRKGSLEFQHAPRFYFNWREHNP